MSTLIVETCKIREIKEHGNADRLEIAIVKGWNCVVQKDRFKKGDIVIYIPIDSILPDDLMNILFGTDAKIKPEKGRIRTIKIRGVISQGLVVSPIEVGLDSNIEEGIDVKEKLDIIKYEPPARNFIGPQQKKMRDRQGENPYFHKYTSIENIKNYPDELIGKEVIISEKIHGSNWRGGYLTFIPQYWYHKLLISLGFFRNKYEFCYGSHNIQLQHRFIKENKHFRNMFGNNIYWEMVKKYNLMKLIPKNHIFYGEVYGNGIQTNYNYGCIDGEHKLVFFDIKKDGVYLDTLIAKDLVESLGLEFVPILYRGILKEDTLDRIDMTKSVLCPSQKVMEGIVIKTMIEQNGRMGRCILKHLNPTYLLNKSNTDWH